MNIELKVGKSYIVKKGYSSPFKIKVIDITATCYELKYESGHVSLVERKEFDCFYSILEELESSPFAKIGVYNTND